MSGRINPATLQEMAEEIGVDPLVLERDWVLTEIVYHLARQPVGQDLVLKGGQALRHVYGSGRFSKDVDDVARRRVDFAELRDLLTIRYPTLKPPVVPPLSTTFGLKIDPISYTAPYGSRVRSRWKLASASISSSPLCPWTTSARFGSRSRSP